MFYFQGVFPLGGVLSIRLPVQSSFCPVLILSSGFRVHSSSYPVVFLSHNLPLQFNSSPVVFLSVHLPVKLSSCPIVFLSIRHPVSIFSLSRQVKLSAIGLLWYGLLRFKTILKVNQDSPGCLSGKSEGIVRLKLYLSRS